MATMAVVAHCRRLRRANGNMRCHLAGTIDTENCWWLNRWSEARWGPLWILHPPHPGGEKQRLRGPERA